MVGMGFLIWLLRFFKILTIYVESFTRMTYSVKNALQFFKNYYRKYFVFGRTHPIFLLLLKVALFQCCTEKINFLVDLATNSSVFCCGNVTKITPLPCINIRSSMKVLLLIRSIDSCHKFVFY